MMNSPTSLLRDLFAAGDAGDLDSFEKYLHPDIVVHAPVGLSTNGLEAERDSWRKAKEAIPDLRHDFQELLSEGSTVSARCIVTGTLRGKFGGFSAVGRHFIIDQALFAHVRDGKIDELWEIVDTSNLTAQLGSAVGINATPTPD